MVALAGFPGRRGMRTLLAVAIPAVLIIVVVVVMPSRSPEPRILYAIDSTAGMKGPVRSSSLQLHAAEVGVG